MEQLAWPVILFRLCNYLITIIIMYDIIITY